MLLTVSKVQSSARTPESGRPFDNDGLADALMRLAIENTTRSAEYTRPMERLKGIEMRERFYTQPGRHNLPG